MDLIHGGDIEGFRLEKGYEPLDFSANCNPLGVPDGVKKTVCAAAEHADAYPDPLCRRLGSVIAKHEGVSPRQVLCGNGSADLIYRLALAGKPKRAVVTAPTFSEYETALKTVGCEVMHYTLSAMDGFNVTKKIFDCLTSDIDMLFLCNPNNPTGLTIDQKLLETIADRCGENATLLIIDECFNGFLDEPYKHTLKGKLNGRKKLLILKAFTKLYGMAGIRLGYCLSDNKELLVDMQKAGQPWAVSSLAQEAGIAALNENEYVSLARALVRKEKEFLLESLKPMRANALGSDANYIFFYSEIPLLAQRLRNRGILIRDCSNFAGLKEGYYRIAVRTHEENLRFIAAMDECAREAT